MAWGVLGSLLVGLALVAVIACALKALAPYPALRDACVGTLVTAPAAIYVVWAEREKATLSNLTQVEGYLWLGPVVVAAGLTILLWAKAVRARWKRDKDNLKA